LLMQSLSIKQMEFVTDTVHLLKLTNKPVYRFLSGGAGTGKSYVLAALRETLERFYKKDTTTDFRLSYCAVIAPTGRAAYIAHGQTIHSVLHIPVNQSLNYTRLDHDTLNTVRTQVGHIKVWLIDEISMVGNKMFALIHQRLQEIYNNAQPFGGASVIAFGDLFQLPPVMDSFIFKILTTTKESNDNYNALAPNIWKDHFQMFELTEIMRQQDCIEFAQLLNRLREEKHTQADIDLLKTRIISKEHENYPTAAQHLFRTNIEVDTHNTHIFMSSSQQKYTVTAIDSVVGALSKGMMHRVLTMIPTDIRKTVQLPQQLQLLIEGRYELCANINVNDGLANGTGGILKRVDLSSSNNTAAGIIWMDFEHKNIGKETRNDAKHLYTRSIPNDWTPIHPLSRQFQVGKSQNSQVIRKQFPVRHSAAKSIHRAQGDTLEEVVVDFTSSRKQAHIHYVGLSRVRNLNNLYITNLNENKIHTNNDVHNEMTELRSDRKLTLSLQFPYSLNDNLLKIIFLNVRSLHAHFADIKKSQLLQGCNMQIYCETCLTQEEVQNHTYNIDGYNSLMYAAECSTARRPYYGLAHYINIPVTDAQQLTKITDTTVIKH